MRSHAHRPSEPTGGGVRARAARLQLRSTRSTLAVSYYELRGHVTMAEWLSDEASTTLLKVCYYSSIYLLVSGGRN